MVTYKGCFPGTFQEPHHVTGPAPAPPPRSRPARADAPSRRPCHAGAAVAECCPAAPPHPPPPAGPRATRRDRGDNKGSFPLVQWIDRSRRGRREHELSSGTHDSRDLLQAFSRSVPWAALRQQKYARSLNRGICELDWRIFTTQVV
ncbi:insulinoma-associated protein 1-like [Neopelma chrysocephalum]|uniref:insulinoma-associated protein 1-like n=1 Tax=Neopelma chrysocephalum TaxID=114329 RepID=UPI000FCD313C|nr:insulinoma-associated protein 1-like [Neopelma chrysocephalum]